jgi:hypothetical protein
LACQDTFSQTVTLYPPLFPLLTSVSAPGNAYFEQYSKEQQLAVAVVHNNYVIGHEVKKQRFQKAGLWLVNDELPEPRLRGGAQRRLVELEPASGH